MSKVLRTCAVVVAASLAVPLWAVPTAQAASASEPASIGAYFYSAGVDKPEESPAAPPNLTADYTDGVAAGHLAVAVRAPGQADKMSFLYFGLTAVPFDATITKAVVTVPLAEQTPPTTHPREANIQRNPAPDKVRVCASGPEGFNGEDGASFAAAPAVDCEAFSAPGTETADKKAYSFDISGLATTWLTSANNGLALVPAEDATSSEFQVVFLPYIEASIAVEYTEAPAETTTDVFTPDVPLTPDVGFSGGTGSFDGGSADAGFGSVDAPVVDTAVPEPAAQVAPEPQAALPVSNVAGFSEAPFAPSASFWLGLLAVAAVLGLMSLIMGDPRVPAAGAARQSRLTQALQQRQRGTSSGPRLAPRPISI